MIIDDARTRRYSEEMMCELRVCLCAVVGIVLVKPVRKLLPAGVSPTIVLEVFSGLENVCDVLVWTAGTGDCRGAAGMCALVDYDEFPARPVKRDITAEIGCGDLASCKVSGILIFAIVNEELQTDQSG